MKIINEPINYDDLLVLVDTPNTPVRFAARMVDAWEKGEVDWVVAAFKFGLSARQIATTLGRNVGGVQEKLREKFFFPIGVPHSTEMYALAGWAVEKEITT